MTFQIRVQQCAIRVSQSPASIGCGCASRDGPPFPRSLQHLIFSKEIQDSDETPTKLTPIPDVRFRDWRSRECDGMESNQTRSIRMNRVRELRENRLMTQAQLARKAKVALRTIHSVEKGMNCRMDTKRKILLAFGTALRGQGPGVSAGPPGHARVPDQSLSRRCRSAVLRTAAGGPPSLRGFSPLAVLANAGLFTR